jgi:cytochrome c553
VDEMPMVYQASSLQMEWCLACHREPEKFVRPKEQVFNMKWPAENKSERQLADARKLLEKYDIKNPNILTSCSTCHR